MISVALFRFIDFLRFQSDIFYILPHGNYKIKMQKVRVSLKSAETLEILLSLWYTYIAFQYRIQKSGKSHDTR